MNTFVQPPMYQMTLQMLDLIFWMLHFHVNKQVEGIVYRKTNLVSTKHYAFRFHVFTMTFDDPHVSLAETRTRSMSEHVRSVRRRFSRCMHQKDMRGCTVNLVIAVRYVRISY